MGFLSATSDIDLELLQDFDLSEFEGLFGRSENNDESNSSSSTSGGSGPTEGASQATPTQPKTNQEAENAEQPSEVQQVKNFLDTCQTATALCKGLRVLMHFHLLPAGGGRAASEEAQRLCHSTVCHRQELRDEVRQ